VQYRREIDGLRAVAVVPVILFHAGFAQFAGGYVGVDVFFVISGFLITSIIVEELEKGRFSLVGFYERRARRILPALFFVSIVCIPFALLLLPPTEIKNFGQSLVAVSVFLSNVFFWMESGYFDTAAELKPLLHTWSLAVEEQFYIAFPLLLMATWALGLRRVVAILSFIFVISLAFAHWSAYNAPSAGFFLPHTRAWELLVGVFSALYLRSSPPERSRWVSEALSLLGLAAILYAVFAFDQTTPFPSLYALLPTVGTALIILFAVPGTLAHRVLSLRLMVTIGILSYSLYLWHQPVFVFARTAIDMHAPREYFLLLFALVLLLSLMSERFVERPFRKRGVRPTVSRLQVFTLSTVASAAIFLMGLYAHQQNGFEARFNYVAPVEREEIAMPHVGNGYCFRDFFSVDISPADEDCLVGEKSAEARILLLGDSFAGHWEPYFDRLGEELGEAIAVRSTNWCFPTLRDDSTAPAGHISREQCALDRAYLRESMDLYDTIVLAGQWGSVVDDNYKAGVVELVNVILEETGASVVLMDSPPYFQKTFLEWAFFDPGAALLVDQEREELALRGWRILRDTFEGRERVLLVDRGMFGDDFVETGRSANGFPYSFDGIHLSVFGAKALFDESRDGAASIIGDFMLRLPYRD
jgi:peptidoglycan/LPS O-acetylase OafA/YrhL